MATEVSPLGALKRFFVTLRVVDRKWLALVCAYQTQNEPWIFESTEDVETWLDEFLAPTRIPLQRFARLVWLVALIDIEVSEPSIRRVHARAVRLSKDSHSHIAEMGEKTLREMPAQMKRIREAWLDVRTHELDEASLCVYRDETERETGQRGLWRP